ncbi:MAG: fibronectin/fibrinogen-binding protein [Syntrophomonadaceae bacterium]|jgi:predicted ribosome quality control (RQC) complex YloA/Tae2 family protein|nr:fibronectin/fibrinogen-binding protein [Syntrophomonadaceae bacterium]
MPFDGLAISHLVRELNQQLAGQRIEKIYQPERDQLTLVIRQKRGSSHLIISINQRWARMYISRERGENPAQPTAFCMLLRKHLEGAKILGFVQQDFDRIVWLKVAALNDLMEWQEKVLVCEFTGKNANVVLIDPHKNIIVDGMKRYGHELSSHREVHPGVEYVPPPSQDKLNPTTCDYSMFYQSLWSDSNHSSTISTALFRTLKGFSPVTCRELCSLAGIEPDSPVGECGDYELSNLFFNIIPTLISETNPTLVEGANGPEEFFSFIPVRPENKNLVSYDSLNLAMDTFYNQRLAQIRFESLRANISRNVKTLLDKAYRKLFFQEGDLEQAQKSEILKVYGELLTAYGYQIPKGQSKVILPNFDGLGETEIELQPHLTPQQNAQRYFKQYAKAKKARNRLEELIAYNRQDIRYLESIQVSLDKASTIEEIEEIIDELEEQGFARPKTRSRSRPAASSPRRFMSTDGLCIWVGKNNRQNEALTLKTSRKTDLWLHAQGFAGAHVILELPPSVASIDEVPVSSLEEAAILAGYYSRGKDAEKVAVDYTFRSQVKKPRGSRPGMVIYDNYWTVFINPSDPRLPAILQTAAD